MNSLSDLAQPQQQGGHFNGVVKFQGQPVEVKNGQAVIQGDTFTVSDDGMLVVDSDRRFVGLIQDGQFIQATPEIIDQLKQAGVFENEQSQGMAAQAQG
jgi:hypothetical protein